MEFKKNFFHVTHCDSVLILVQTYIEHPEHAVSVILSMFTSLISLAQMLKLHCSLVQLPAGGKDVMQPMQSTHTHTTI